MYRTESALLLLAGSAALAAAQPGPTVKTTAGEAYGTRLPASAGGVEVNQFLGLPFAHAVRWEPPVDFKGTYPEQPRNSTMFGHACMQVLTSNTTYGSEDCLSANVWQPANANPDSKLKVLVFIYGGSDQFGEAEPYNMSALSAFHDTVTVNFNYRTGPIGWMAFEDDVDAGVTTGNYGILDIQSALRWVQREIGAFGGDPTQVAIHGQSSGGGLVELQYVSPTAKGLFNGIISESGGLGARALNDTLANSKAMSKLVGCYNKPFDRADKKCMSKLDPLVITNLTYLGDWGPGVDNIVIPADPATLLAEGKINPVNAILGAQTNDSQLFLFKANTKGDNMQPNNYTNGDLKPMARLVYEASILAKVGKEYITEALSLYPPIGEHKSIENLHQLGRVESDSMLCGNVQRAKMFRKAGRKAYVYRFNYWYQSNAACTAVPNFHLPYMGAVHQDEVTFVLGQPNFMELGSCCGKWGLSEGQEGCPKDPTCTACYDKSLGDGYRGYFNDLEWEFTRLIGGFWTNFTSGNPNGGFERWPSIENGMVVFDARHVGGMSIETAVNGDPRICKLWDAVNDSK